MQFPEPTLRAVGDVDLAVYEMGEGRPVVLVHGFPELAYSWRHQMPALANAGYRAIAFDMRGYGASDAPEAVDDYGIETVVGDLVGLVAVMRLDDPVLIGHDWGSIVAQSARVMHPGVFSAGGSLNVPYRGWCAGFPTLAQIAENNPERFGYVLRFHEGSKTEDAFAADPERFLRRFYDAVAVRKDFLEDEDFARYLDAFRATGISPALAYYRNIDANAAATAHLANRPIEGPFLMALADGDPILPPALAEGMERWVPEVRQVLIPGAGHWVQQEQPDAVSAAIVEFLDSLG